jgi:AcrR family transcriptional regulator
MDQVGQGGGGEGGHAFLSDVIVGAEDRRRRGARRVLSVASVAGRPAATYHAGDMAKQSTRRGRAQPPPADPQAQIVDALMRVVALQGWRETRLGDVAEEAGLPLAELHRHFLSKGAILCAFLRRIDQQVLDGTDPDIAAEPVRDRLFDVLMRRLDALRPHKAGVRRLGRDLLRCPPAAAAFAAGPMAASLQWMLTAARIEPWGPLQPLQVKGLGLIHLSVLRVWADDDSEDQSKTMAALDKALDRADRLVGRLRRGRRRPPPADAAAEAAEA